MRNRLVPYFIAFILVAAAALGYMALRNAVPTQPQKNIPHASTTASAVNNSPQHFVSAGLGISFDYGSEAEVYATGTKIYVYLKDTDPFRGQTLEVFAKRASETLQDSVTRQVLVGYSNACSVTVEEPHENTGLVKAEIAYAQPAKPGQPAWSEAAMCNARYAKSNGLRYFLYDPDHSRAFVFVDIGQYAISSGHGSEGWQDTITFLP